MGFDSKKDQVHGRTEQAAGELTNDEDMKARGEGRETKGEAKEAVDSAKDKLHEGLGKLSDKTDDNNR